MWWEGMHSPANLITKLLQAIIESFKILDNNKNHNIVTCGAERMPPLFAEFISSKKRVKGERLNIHTRDG
jgi:hypothetical protein